MNREPLVEDIQNYALNIVDTVREPLLILDATLRVRSANRASYQTFQVSAEETVDRLIYELGNGQWDRLYHDDVPADADGASRAGAQLGERPVRRRGAASRVLCEVFLEHLSTSSLPTRRRTHKKVERPKKRGQPVKHLCEAPLGPAGHVSN